MRILSIEEMELQTGGGFWSGFCLGLGIATLSGGFLIPGANVGLIIANGACLAYDAHNLFS